MPGLRSSSWIGLFCAATLSFAGCSGEPTSGESGSLNVNLDLEGDVKINQVDWEITGNGMEPMSGTINTSVLGATASVEVFGLPPGTDYLITMTATSADGETSCGGSAEFDVEVGVSTNVMVMLNCKPPRDLGGVRVNGKFNICADLVKVVVSPLQTSVGNDIDLAAAGNDYEGDDFEFLWEATGGSIDDPSAAETFYTCEEVGNHEVRVIVSDDGFNDCMCDWTVAITCVDAELCDGIMCDDGEICVDEVCVPIGECVEDDDCADREICRDFECVDLCSDTQCDDENECTVGMCNPDTGMCDYTDVEDGMACDEENGICIEGECKTNELLGDDFVIVFEANYVCEDEELCGAGYSPPQLTLFLSGPQATDGVVSIPAIGFSQPFSVTPGAVTTVLLPPGSEIRSSDVIEEQAAVRITTNEQITVYGLNHLFQTTDAFAALPTEILGLRHRVMAWNSGLNGPSQLAIGAIPAFEGDETTPTNVTITPASDADGRPAGVPYTVVLEPFDAYQLQSDGDLTGSLIESDRTISVFGGNRCANIPNQGTAWCDHLVEQIPPVTSWGSEALTVPLATRTMGDTFRVLADQDGTEVQLHGASPDSVTLNAGEFAQWNLTESYRISASAPILVAQYSNGTEWDGVVSDPFMMLIPSATQFMPGYTFATPGMGFPANYANIVALTTDAMAGNVEVDGASVPAEDFTELTGTDYSAAQRPISVGSHTLEAPNPLGLYVYGFDVQDSYGYSGGFSAGVTLP